uniref:Uncharacterized protein n=1 Tax=Pyxicephalus adspersus TaxID=30357 RepID=A0AAV2ZRS8_PYXAD|nr:TPA: hypothetical protein GDO54_005402 [Pyxicephalus adspersus]
MYEKGWVTVLPIAIKQTFKFLYNLPLKNERKNIVGCNRTFSILYAQSVNYLKTIRYYKTIILSNTLCVFFILVQISGKKQKQEQKILF